MSVLDAIPGHNVCATPLPSAISSGKRPTQRRSLSLFFTIAVGLDPMMPAFWVLHQLPRRQMPFRSPPALLPLYPLSSTEYARLHHKPLLPTSINTIPTSYLSNNNNHQPSSQPRFGIHHNEFTCFPTSQPQGPHRSRLSPIPSTISSSPSLSSLHYLHAFPITENPFYFDPFQHVPDDALPSSTSGTPPFIKPTLCEA